MTIFSERSAFSLRLFFLVLFFFPAVLSADPYESVYILPDESIEIKTDIFFVEKQSTYCVGRYGLGVGASDTISFLYSFDYIHGYFGSKGVSGPGDSHAGLRWAFLDWNNLFFSSLCAGFTIPTGGNLYSSNEWSGLSFGNYEIYAGMNLRYDLDELVLSSSARYLFRQGSHENAFFQRFFYPSHLVNDYGNCSVSAMFLRLYPVTAWCSAAVSFRVWKRSSVDDEIPAEGCGITPVPLSAGVRWFFTRDAFLSVYGAEQLIRYAGYIRRSAGASLSFVF